MPPRGRRHWTEAITILERTGGARDPNDPMGARTTETWAPVAGFEDVPAAVQSLDRRRVHELGLDTTREWWWIRTSPGVNLTRDAHRITWRGVTLRLESVNPGVPIPGDDLEITATRA